LALEVAQILHRSAYQDLKGWWTSSSSCKRCRSSPLLPCGSREKRASPFIECVNNSAGLNRYGRTRVALQSVIASRTNRPDKMRLAFLVQDLDNRSSLHGRVIATVPGPPIDSQASLSLGWKTLKRSCGFSTTLDSGTATVSRFRPPHCQMLVPDDDSSRATTFNRPSASESYSGDSLKQRAWPARRPLGEIWIAQENRGQFFGVASMPSNRLVQTISKVAN
jgi:hypothetical protein